MEINFNCPWCLQCNWQCKEQNAANRIFASRSFWLLRRQIFRLRKKHIKRPNLSIASSWSATRRTPNKTSANISIPPRKLANYHSINILSISFSFAPSQVDSSLLLCVPGISSNFRKHRVKCSCEGNREDNRNNCVKSSLASSGDKKSLQPSIVESFLFRFSLTNTHFSFQPFCILWNYVCNE